MVTCGDKVTVIVWITEYARKCVVDDTAPKTHEGQRAISVGTSVDHESLPNDKMADMWNI